MMTIEEAIEHAEEQAKKLGDCKCAEEHKQLARWLRELLELRSNSPVAQRQSSPL